MKKAFLLVTATLLLGACSEMPSAPTTQAPTGAARRDLICEAGYDIAYDGDGNEYCKPDNPPPPPEGQGLRAAKPTSSK